MEILKSHFPVHLTSTSVEQKMCAAADDSTVRIDKPVTKLPDSDEKVWLRTGVADGE